MLKPSLEAWLLIDSRMGLALNLAVVAPTLVTFRQRLEASELEAVASLIASVVAPNHVAVLRAKMAMALAWERNFSRLARWRALARSSTTVFAPNPVRDARLLATLAQTHTGSTRRTDDRDDQGGREVARGTRSGALAPAAAGGAAGAMAKSNGDAKNDGDNDSSDSSSTTDMEKTRKHMRGKELITAGLATVATIHAAHGVYSSMEAHEKRHRLVAEGEMSPEEARKKQTKAWIQDAAAVGIAALGIKGAFSEWKEMNEQRREIQEIEKRKAARRKKRAARQKQEEMERHERMMNILEKNPQLAIGHQMQQNGYFPNTMGGAAPTPDQSGNPYASAQRY